MRDAKNREQKNREAPHGVSLLAMTWLLACLSTGLWLIFGGKSPPPQSLSSAQNCSTKNIEDASAHPRYCNVEDIRVGQRVMTDGGIANSLDGKSRAVDINATRVDPKSWRLVSLRVEAHVADGGQDVMQVQVIMPLALLEQEHAKPGSRIPVPLDLGDIDEQGYRATVEAIEPCPPIQAGPGRVVLATLKHASNYVFRLAVADASGRQETLGVTGFHKLYAQDRGWTSVADLHMGEHLRGSRGDLTVASLVRELGRREVYNLSVEDDHVYYVGKLATLSHNILDCDVPDLDPRSGRLSGDLPNPQELTPDQARSLADKLEQSVDMRQWNNDGPLDEGHQQRLDAEIALLNQIKKLFGL